MVLLPYLPSDLFRKDLWSFYHFGDFPLPLRVVLALIGLLVWFKWINDKVWIGFLFAAGWIGKRVMSLKTGILYVLIGSAFFPIFWLLRIRNYKLGDSIHLIEFLTLDVHLKGYHLWFDEPLELLIHSVTYSWLHRVLDWGAAESYALTSCLCGVGFVLVVLYMCRAFSGGWTDRALCFGLFFSMGAVELFFGSVENYTIAALGIVSYLLISWYYLEGRCKIALPSLVLSFSICMHVLAGWLLPSLLYLYLAGTKGLRLKDRTLQFGIMVLSVLAPIGATIGLFSIIGYGPEHLTHTHLSRLNFIFLRDRSYSLYQYPAFSTDHIIAVLNQIILTGLPGAAAICFVLLFYFKHIDFKDQYLRFLFLVALFFQVFAIVWNPDIGAFEDWDLFAVVGLGYVPLGGYLMVRFVKDKGRMMRGALVIIAVSGAHCWTWILSNSTVDIYVNDRHDIAHILLGNSQVKSGDIAGAVTNYKEALRANPQNYVPHFNLGQIYYKEDRKDEALFELRESLKLSPPHRYSRRARNMIDKLKLLDEK